MRIVLFDNVTVDLRASPEVLEKILKQYIRLSWAFSDGS